MSNKILENWKSIEEIENKVKDKVMPYPKNNNNCEWIKKNLI